VRSAKHPTIRSAVFCRKCWHAHGLLHLERKTRFHGTLKFATCINLEATTRYLKNQNIFD
jgi:hypothetical protein